MNELPSIEDRVSKGIAYIEEKGAADWAERIVAAVEADAFFMYDGCRCAVGVTLGEYVNVLGPPLDYDGDAITRFAAPLGFNASDSEDRVAVLHALEAEWERRAREHASYRAGVLGE